MTEIRLNPEGPVMGSEFMRAIQDSFSTREWMGITVRVKGRIFSLGVLGEPLAMMTVLTDLVGGGEIVVDVPDDIFLEWERFDCGLNKP